MKLFSFVKCLVISQGPPVITSGHVMALHLGQIEAHSCNPSLAHLGNLARRKGHPTHHSPGLAFPEGLVCTGRRDEVGLAQTLVQEQAP